MRIQELKFEERINKSEKLTFQIMENLFERKLIKRFFKTKLQEDIAGTDFLTSFDNKNDLKIQFKLRQDKWKDIPICRYQPFRGIDNCVVGRDYKSITNDVNDFYFVATQNREQKFDEVYVTETNKLKKLIIDAEKEWFPDSQAWDFFTQGVYQKYMDLRLFSKKIREASNGVEAWFKKNPNEGSGKINYYVPVSYADTILKLL